MTDLDLLDERLRRAFVEASSADAGSPTCPTPDRIWRAAHDETLHAAREVVEHLAECASCAEAWRLAIEIGDEAAAATAEASEDRRAKRIGWASAAAAVLAFVVLSWNRDSLTTQSSVARASDDELVITLVQLPTSTSGGCRLAWTGVAGATYDVQLFDSRLDLLLERRGLGEPTLDVPLSAIAGAADLRAYVVARRGATQVADHTLDAKCPV